MVAYSARHSTDDAPWRCVLCDKLGKHADADIVPHLTSVHSLSADRLRTEHGDQIFLYPALDTKVKV